MFVKLAALLTLAQLITASYAKVSYVSNHQWHTVKYTHAKVSKVLVTNTKAQLTKKSTTIYDMMWARLNTITCNRVSLG